MSEAIRDGDIFHWRYADERPDDLGPWRRYHCKSQFAVANDGKLTDTYWGGASSHDVSVSYEEARKLWSLTYLGNFDGLKKVPEYEGEYYDENDIVNLNHANSSRGNFYIRVGAKRSKAKILSMAQYKLDVAKREEKAAYERTRRYASIIDHIDNDGDLSEVHL
jgi:hypothetical protein